MTRCHKVTRCHRVPGAAPVPDLPGVWLNRRQPLDVALRCLRASRRCHSERFLCSRTRTGRSRCSIKIFQQFFENNFKKMTTRKRVFCVFFSDKSRPCDGLTWFDRIPRGLCAGAACEPIVLKATSQRMLFWVAEGICSKLMFEVD